ncbi:MAG: citrate synthase [Leptospiraceae bacterium]|nr:citrate synthase [Leptospiraceae bacterium]
MSEGTDGSQGIHIGELYNKTGLVTIDPGYFNTASGVSEISKRDADKGELIYRGYHIEDLVKNSTFVETSYLLIYGSLPTQNELSDFSKRLSKHSLIHENMINLLDGFPGKAHPLAVLSVMVMSLSSYYPDNYEESLDRGIDLVTRLLAKIRTIAAYIYKKMVGQPFNYPQDKLPYCTNFLQMMFAIPTEPYEVKPEHDKILNQFWIMYAEHEMNVAAATVEMIGSTQANLFASISAGMSALWGSREGGKNVAAVELIEDILKNGGDVKNYFEKFKNGGAKLDSNGFGHEAYKGTSPRSVVAKELFRNFYKNTKDPIAETALKVEEYVLNDPYFIKENLYPNLDFYSGVIFHSLGIPKNMFTVMQTIGKLPGWLAHWRQLRLQTKTSKARPRQIYTGKVGLTYKPIEKR